MKPAEDGQRASAQQERARSGPHAGPAGAGRGASTWPPPDYSVPSGHFDELQSGGELRPAWQRFAAQAGDLGNARLAQAQQWAALRIRENGVTYNLQDESDAGLQRSWTVDALPFLLTASEWEPLAHGLRQRARLLEAMAADFYGEQKLVGEGLVPAALVQGHSDFARSAVGFAVRGGLRLHQIAFDVGRGPDGIWRVIGTRAQGPSGAGYSLENRSTISRLFPDAFRELRVQMLARFFRSMQARLRDNASGQQSTHFVLLTPGSFSETYFEQAYLARHLGLTLVEGGDLTVRDDRVYLQTLSGLEPVGGILRRLDDDFCDPLELRAESALGVAGLVSAWRAGNVVMANAFGMGVLESPGLYGFLPPLCERLLGETLETASIATWWCGEAAARAEAAAEAERMVLKPAFSGRRMEPVFLGDLEGAERDAALARLDTNPEAYVLQERMPLSHAPAFDEDRLVSRAVMLRVFLVADGAGDYRAMPGGLARIAGRGSDIVSSQRGGSSKDTWILSDGALERSLLSDANRLPGAVAVRSSRSLASRAGENLFWFGRYVERCEHLARLLRSLLPRLLDEEGFGDALLRPVLSCCRRSGLVVDWTVDYSGSLTSSAGELLAAAFARRDNDGLAHDLESSCLCASNVRDWISLDSWRLLSELSRSFFLPSPTGHGEALALVDQLIVTLAAVSGFESERMTRDDGWRVVAIGRIIERIVAATTALREIAWSPEQDEPALLEWLLDLCDASVTYRARYRRAPEWSSLVDLLVYDDTNPRSLAWLLARLVDHTQKLPNAGLELAKLTEELGVCARRASDAGRGELFRPEGDLASFLTRAESLALALSDAIELRYFRHVYATSHSTVGI